MADMKLWDEERRETLDLPFVEVKDNEIVSYWAPPEVTATSEGNQYSAECSLGIAYAARLLEHMIEFDRRGVVMGDCLNFVTKAVVERGKWTGVEIAFFDAIGEYLVKQRIRVSTSFDARMIG
jgi:hypothetical protein